MSTSSLVILSFYILFFIWFMVKTIHDKFALIIVLIGSILISLTMLRSGHKENFGIGFWGPNGHDALWHLAVINQIKQGLPIKNPVFSDEILKNYHVGYDILVASLSLITSQAPIDLYFRFLPITFSLLLGLLVYKLSQRLGYSRIETRLTLIMIYFSSSFGWIINFIKYQNLGGESLFWSMQSASTQINPPFALSLCLLSLGLLFYLQKKPPFATGLIFGLMTIVKIYSGILIAFALAIEFIFSRKDRKQILKILIFQLLLSLLVIVSISRPGGSGFPFIFKPFWFTHTLIESTDRLYLPKLATFIQNISANPYTFKLPLLFIAEIVVFTIFIFGNYGVRLIFLLKRPSQKQRVLWTISILGLIIPLFFIQNGTAWNTIQFLYYSLFCTSILASQVLAKSSKLQLFFLLLIGTLGSVGTLKDYFGFPPPAYLPTHTQKALEYLRALPQGNILTYPYNPFSKSGKATPLPLKDYESTGYVSALTEKPTYLEDQVNLDITGYNWQQRRKHLDNFFQQTNPYESRGFLLNNNLSYIYLEEAQNLPFSPEILQINKIYDNGFEKIFKIQK